MSLVRGSPVGYSRPADRDAFDIAVICALRLESDAVGAMFDQFWEDDDHQYEKIAGDFNSYTFGRIGRHNVVLVYMPGMGKAHSASVAACLRMSFPRIRLALLVGVCGGVPQPPGSLQEILLGDVIISTGVVQIDFGRQYDDQSIRKNTLQDNLGRPSMEIGAFLQQMQGWRAQTALRLQLADSVIAANQREDFKHWRFPGRDCDHLFDAEYRHRHHEPSSDCRICIQCVGPDDAVCESALEASCAQLQCDKARLVHRKRGEKYPMLHFGTLASGDVVMRSALHRDRIARAEKVLGFEMEGAGIWDHFPTVIVKGVCDYADSHKHKQWQPYATFTAAACTKALLREWRGVQRWSVSSPIKLTETPTLSAHQKLSAGDPSHYMVRPWEFFHVGRVFAMEWHFTEVPTECETSGTMLSKAVGKDPSRTVRRMIVVRRYPGHVWCV